MYLNYYLFANQRLKILFEHFFTILYKQIKNQINKIEKKKLYFYINNIFFINYSNSNY